MPSSVAWPAPKTVSRDPLVACPDRPSASVRRCRNGVRQTTGAGAASIPREPSGAVSGHENALEGSVRVSDYVPGGSACQVPAVDDHLGGPVTKLESAPAR